MNIFKSLTSLADQWIFQRWPSLTNSFALLSEPSYTGKDIDERKANNCSVVWACQRVISDPVGMLPLHLYRRIGDDERVRDRANPLYRLLHDAPNPRMPAIVFRQTLQAAALTWGNGYARIVRRSSGDRAPLELWPIKSDRIGPIVEDDGRTMYYRVRTKEGNVNLPFDDVLHIPGLGFDGIAGESVISLARNSIGLDMAALEYGGRFFARGGRVPYVLKHPSRFKSTKEFDEWSLDWEGKYRDPHRAVILEGGLEYQQIGYKPEDAQLLATRKFSVEEICRWFLVYPFEVGDMSRANFSNIEQLTIDRIFHTVGYWLKLWEEQIWLRLLPESMKDTHYVEFDRNAILMGDFETRMRGYSTALQNGFMNADTVCARENLPKLPNGGGSAYHIQMNMQTVPGTGEPTAIERAALARADAAAVKKAQGG